MYVPVNTYFMLNLISWLVFGVPFSKNPIQKLGDPLMQWFLLTLSLVALSLFVAAIYLSFHQW